MHNLVVKEMAHDRLASQIFQRINDTCVCCNNYIVNKQSIYSRTASDYSHWQCQCNDFYFNIFSYGYDHSIQIIIFDFKFIFRITESSCGGLNYSYIKLNDTQLELIYFDDCHQAFNSFKDFLSLYTKYKKLAVLA